MTEAELPFVRRMAFHVKAGKTFDEAAQAVLEDDKRLIETFGAYQHSSTKREEQRELCSALSLHIYERLRAKT